MTECSSSDHQRSNFKSCVWRAVSPYLSHYSQEVDLVSLVYMCKRRSFARPQTARARISNPVSGGQCHLIHLIILRRFSWPSLAYMGTFHFSFVNHVGSKISQYCFNVYCLLGIMKADVTKWLYFMLGHRRRFGPTLKQHRVNVCSATL